MKNRKLKYIITLSMIFILKVTIGQLPKKYGHLDYLFNDKNRIFEGDLPDSLLKSIDTTLINVNLIYREFFHPMNYELRDTLGFSLILKERELHYVVERDTVVYHVESYFYDRPELFSGDFDVFLNNKGRSHIGYLSLYFIDKEVAVIKEFAYFKKKFLFFKWEVTKVKSVFLLEL